MKRFTVTFTAMVPANADVSFDAENVEEAEALAQAMMEEGLPKNMAWDAGKIEDPPPNEIKIAYVFAEDE